MGLVANSGISLGDVVCRSIQLRFLMMLEVTHIVYGTEESTGRLNKGPGKSPRHMGLLAHQRCVARRTTFSVKLSVHKIKGV